MQRFLFKFMWLCLSATSLGSFTARACPFEQAADAGLLKRPQPFKLPPTDIAGTDMWDSWVVARQTPNGTQLVRYTLASTRGNYLPADAPVSPGSALWQKLIERDRHDYAYLRILTSEDLGQTWQDQGAKLVRSDGPVWTGGTLVHADQSATVFMTIPEARGTDWHQTIWRARSKNGIELDAPEPLFTAEAMQEVAIRKGYPYEFLSTEDGYVSAFRDFHPFEINTSDGAPIIGALIAAKVRVGAKVVPGLAQLRATDATFKNWELMPPMTLEALPLGPHQIEVPNLIQVGERLVLHYAVSYEQGDRYIRATYAAETTVPRGGDVFGAPWRTVRDGNGAPLQVTSPESHVYGVGAIRLPGTSQVLYQGFFNGYHPRTPVAPTAAVTIGLDQFPATPRFDDAAVISER